MARVAKLNGNIIRTVNIAPQVDYHLTTGDAEGDVRVTPEVFGRIQNDVSFNIPAVILADLTSNGIAPSDNIPSETDKPKGK